MNRKTGTFLSAALLAGAVCMAPVAASATGYYGFGGGSGYSIFSKGGTYGYKTFRVSKSFKSDGQRFSHRIRGSYGSGHGLYGLLKKYKKYYGQHRGHDGWGKKKQDHAPVPIPATLPLLLGGVGAIAIARRRRALK